MRRSDSQISAKSPAGSLPRLGPLTALGYRRHCPPGSADPSPGAYIREANLHLAFELLVLTAALGGEVRATAWTEIDLYDEVWTIPALRTKTNREHRVSLTGRALDILAGRGSPLVFPMRGKPLCNAALSRLLKRFDPSVKFAGSGHRPRFVATLVGSRIGPTAAGPSICQAGSGRPRD